MKIQAIIIDDEQNSIDNLSNLLVRYVPDVHVIAHSTTARDAELLVRQLKPHVVFLDIEMPHINGLTMASYFANIGVEIIFITAFEQYAVEAFRKNAVDYILKPINVDELQDAVQKLRNKLAIGKPSTQASASTEAFEKIEAAISSSKLKLPTHNGFELVNSSDVMYFEAHGSYSFAHILNHKTETLSRNLGEIERMLPAHFIRIHNKYIINSAHIASYISGRGGQIVLKDGAKLDVSHRRKKPLMDLIQHLQ